MSIELISALVANGTTAWNWGYEPWLPFYNFFPVLVMASIAVAIGAVIFEKMSPTRAVMYGAVYLTSGLSSVLVVYLLWREFDLSPSEVFGWWVINFVLIMIGQAYLIWRSRHVKQRLKEMEDRKNDD